LEKQKLWECHTWPGQSFIKPGQKILGGRKRGIKKEKKKFLLLGKNAGGAPIQNQFTKKSGKKFRGRGVMKPREA